MSSERIKSKAPKQVTQAELRRAFNMAMRAYDSPRTLAFHRAIARRLDAGAEIGQPGPFKAHACKSANGSFGLNVERTYTTNPCSHLILALQLVDEEIALLRDARKKIELQAARAKVERAWLKGTDRHQLGSEVRPAMVRTGKSTKMEREYIGRLKKSGYQEATPEHARQSIAGKRIVAG
jgi:hypothetical protein